MDEDDPAPISIEYKFKTEQDLQNFIKSQQYALVEHGYDYHIRIVDVPGGVSKETERVLDW